MLSNIDKQGRIVIPSGVRKALKLKTGDQVKVTLAENKMIVEPGTDQKCVICQTTSKLLNVDGVYICNDCAKKLGGQKHE